MQIYVVKPGDTLYSIGRALSLAPGFLARYNGLREPYRLAVGQSLLVLYPEQTVTVRAGDALSSIAASSGTDVLSLFRMNPNLSGSDQLYPGQVLVTQLEQSRTRSAFVGGYAYPYVQESVLRGILPFAGALMPFTYGFTPEGALMPMDDERLLALAGEYGVRPFLHLSTLTAAGTFSAAQAAVVLRSEALQQTLAEAVLQRCRKRAIWAWTWTLNIWAGSWQRHTRSSSRVCTGCLRPTACRSSPPLRPKPPPISPAPSTRATTTPLSPPPATQFC